MENLVKHECGFGCCDAHSQALNTLNTKLDDLQRGVNGILAFIDTVTNTVEQARNAPGMAGMMARQAIPDLKVPDLSQFRVPGA